MCNFALANYNNGKVKKTEAEKTELKIQRLFNRGCADYHLLKDGDKVLVALSGGKDSLELVRLMARQMRIHKPQITVEAAHIIMDNIPYETDRSYIQKFCEELGMKLNILHSSFEESGVGSHLSDNSKDKHRQKTKCFLCSWNRRKTLFEYARDNGFNKIALGHHQDDILITLLMNMTFEGSIQTMPPILKMDHYPISIIRPLCLVPEHLIAHLAKLLGFEKQKTACPYEEKSRRQDMAEVYHTLECMNPEVRYSLWRSMTNVKQGLLPNKQTTELS